MKFKQLQERAPAFKQIIVHGDTIDALDHRGCVWTYIPAAFGQNVEGWMMLSRATVGEDHA